MTEVIRVAAAQYPIEWLDTLAAWQAKFARWVAEAAGAGAQLLVFPEYGSMELASIFGRTVAADLHDFIAAMNSVLDEVDRAHAEAAARHGVHILAASFPVRGADGCYRNVARLFTPGGAVGVQQKLIMTRFEREDWHIAPGGPLRVFDTALGRIGISICYDVEFPLIARAQCEAGAALILAPSCTEKLSGYWRVRVGAQARALENQCYVVHAPTVGMAPWSPAVDENRGAAGVYAPPDVGFPDDGIVALGEMDQPQWLYADVDLALVARVREEGNVLNHRDWARQDGAAVCPAEVVDLRR